MATFIVQGKREQALKRIAEKNGLEKFRSFGTVEPEEASEPTKVQSSKISLPEVPDVTPSPSEAPTVIENVSSKTGATPSPSKTPTAIESVPSKAEIEVTNKHQVSEREASAGILYVWNNFSPYCLPCCLL